MFYISMPQNDKNKNTCFVRGKEGQLASEKIKKIKEK